MKKIIFGISIFMYSSMSLGYGSVEGKVLDVRIDRDGRGIIKFDGPIEREPASCRVAAYSSHFSFDASTDGGKAIYTMALAARVPQKK